MQTTPPATLQVVPSLDGFRCAVRPRARRGSDSALLLLWVPLWWGLSGAVAVAVTAVRPELLNAGMLELPWWALLAFPVALVGWAPAWIWLDARRAAAVQPLEVTGTHVIVGDTSYPLTDIAAVRDRGRELFLVLEHGGEVAVGTAGLGWAERQWLGPALEAAIAVRFEPDQPVPAPLDALRSPADR